MKEALQDDLLSCLLFHVGATDSLKYCNAKLLMDIIPNSGIIQKNYGVLDSH